MHFHKAFIPVLLCIGMCACTHASPETVSFSAPASASAASSSISSPSASSETPSVSPLHVEGTHLCNEENETVQLKGVSTHGIAWYPQYVSYDAFRTLKEDWHANVIRLAMYTGEEGGYCNGGNQEELKAIVKNGVEYASQLGMYAIIDWHILSDGNPASHEEEAVSFFQEMSGCFSDYDNVIYEVCNEPNGTDWETIRSYEEDLIQVIRHNDPDAVILCGTPVWCQDIDQVESDPIAEENILYTVHFYAGTHKEFLRAKVQQALDHGLPVFISECGICQASGDGGIDYDSAGAWMNLINENQISYVCWNLSNKNETSALLKASCSKVSGWDENDLSETGIWFRNAIRGEANGN